LRPDRQPATPERHGAVAVTRRRTRKATPPTSATRITTPTSTWSPAPLPSAGMGAPVGDGEASVAGALEPRGCGGLSTFDGGIGAGCTGCGASAPKDAK